ncbi:MAG: hypothetical protein K1X52_14665 [Pyrinomonadaceae bacterium]|nr:hypothetical protein [Pyrinomonadaceae bacterium]
MANENQSTNEQPQTDAAATTTTATAAAAEQKAESLGEKADQITDPKATIKIEGQEFEIEAALAQEDKTLKVVLQPHFASIENANITREVEDGKLTVTIVKRAQHKGA